MAFLSKKQYYKSLIASSGFVFAGWFIAKNPNEKPYQTRQTDNGIDKTRQYCHWAKDPSD